MIYKSKWTELLLRLGFKSTQQDSIQPALNNKYYDSIFVMTEMKVPLQFTPPLPKLSEHLQWNVMEIDETEGTMTVSYVREL